MAWFCNRDDVKRALDIAETARNNAQIDRIIEGASRDVEAFLHRRIAPTQATRYVDWPNDQFGRSYRIWLNQNEVISLTQVVSGGTVIPPASWFLEPANDGPPYTRLEINLASTSGFDTGSTHQRDIVLTGLFGYSNEEDQLGALTSPLAASLAAVANVAFTTARVSVGDVLRIDNERCVVTEKTMVNSTQTLLTPVGATSSDATLAVTDGTGFIIDAVLLLDSERMLIVDIAGNNLTVKRAWDGTSLAAHTGSAIWTLTGVQLARAQLGTILAVHLNTAPIYKWRVPGPVRDLTIAEAANTFEQESSAYARTIGSDTAQRPGAGVGLPDIRDRVYASHGRKMRLGVI